MHHIIFVHGISSSIITYNYSLEFQKLLIKKLQENSYLSKDSDWTKVLTFDEVNYSSIGHDAEQNVLTAYQNDIKDKYTLIDKAFEASIFGEIRKQLITAVSDVLVYESDFWRSKIRELVLEKIEQYNPNEPLTIIAHSLGSVVAFDTIYLNMVENSKWQKDDFRPTNFFTMGSPLALFSLEMDNSTGRQRPRYIPEKLMNFFKSFQKNENNEIVKNSWYNFFDAQDIIAFPLESVFKGKFHINDVLVQTGTDPLNAHYRYWSNLETIKIIADQIAEKA